MGDAQVTTADIVGTVTDQSGAAVTDATVTETNLATGVSQKTTVSSSGGFDFTLLQIGTHEVSIQASGFKGFTTQVTLAVGDRARVDAQLTVGQATETVTVAAATPALQTDESTVGTLDRQRGDVVPFLERGHVLNLITLSAG